MKKIFLVAFMALSIVPAFAHPGPHRHPHPGPGPGRYPRPVPHPGPWRPYPPAPQPYPRQCQVAAVDQYNRVIAYFGGNAPMCQDGIAHCQNTVRRQGWWGARCVVVNRW